MGHTHTHTQTREVPCSGMEEEKSGKGTESEKTKQVIYFTYESILSRHRCYWWTDSSDCSFCHLVNFIARFEMQYMIEGCYYSFLKINPCTDRINTKSWIIFSLSLLHAAVHIWSKSITDCAPVFIVNEPQCTCSLHSSNTNVTRVRRVVARTPTG